MNVNIALLTVTDTRTLKTDKSGNILLKKIKKAKHNLIDRKICKDSKKDIKKILKILQDHVPPVVIITSIFFFFNHILRIFLISFLLSLQIFLSIKLCFAFFIFFESKFPDLSVFKVLVSVTVNNAIFTFIIYFL